MGLWISCGQSDKDLAEKQVFRMNVAEGLSTLDPAFARSKAPIWMTAQLFNGLVSLDSDLNIQPSLSKMWEISENGQVYTFHLRKGVFFHKHPSFGPDSSRQVVAEDVVYSFQRICDPSVASTGKWIFSGKIAGLEAFEAGTVPHISGFHALNDSTFQLSLTAPFPPLLGLLAMPYGYVVPREVVEEYGDDFRSQPIGTGPFQLYRWEEGNHLILHRNPNYFESEKGFQLPYLDAVSVRFSPSRLSAFIEFVQGNLDFIGDLDPAYKDEILTRDGEIQAAYGDRYQFILAPQLNTEYLGFQTDTSLEFVQGHPLADPSVRKAINYAIDRPKLVRYLLNGMGYPAEAGFVPNGMPGFDPLEVQGFRFDPEQSAALLAEAGYPQGENLPVLVLNSTQKYAAISEFIQKSLENVGIRVQIQNLQGGALRKEIYGVRVNFWRASWIADYPDSENYLSLFYSGNHSPSGPNTTHFSSVEFDELYQQALSTTDDSLRLNLYHQMDRLMLEQAPIVPLYYDRSIRILQKGITGLGSNPMNHLFLSRVRKENVLNP